MSSSSSHILRKELLLRSKQETHSYDDNDDNDEKQIKPSIKQMITSYQWNENMTKPYTQAIEHELVIDFWARNAKLFKNHSIAGILIVLITNYSVPAFKFRYYGNNKSMGIYKEGLICHQLLKTQCSAIFGPRIKYDGLDANMIYKFKFKMISGNIGIGICSNHYNRWNKLLHNVNNLRSCIIWKNGYYQHAPSGNKRKTGHIDDIFEDNDDIELEINLVKLQCFVRNLTNSRIPKHELPMEKLVKYKGSTGYLQIVIGFFDDYGPNSWVKHAARIQIIEQCGHYIQPNKQ